jgi:hypothetical protein
LESLASQLGIEPSIALATVMAVGHVIFGFSSDAGITMKIDY